MNEKKKQTGSHSAWGDRIHSLRNVPSVLKILWESGPSVVTWGLILRVVVPLLQLGIGVVAARIITGVAGTLHHLPLIPDFWWLVVAEVGLALLNGILSRAIDYSDQLLANRYTYNVRVQVMQQAA